MKSAPLCIACFLLPLSFVVNAAEPLPTALAIRGERLVDDDGTLFRGGNKTAELDGGIGLRATAGRWTRSMKNPLVWRSSWKPGMGHAPVVSYRGLDVKNLIVEVTFRFGKNSESWQHQCFRIAADRRPEITGHVVSAWANPNNDFIETGLLLQHIRKTPEKKVVEDLLLDCQLLSLDSEVWYTAILEVVDDEALFRLGDFVAYAKADPIRLPKNLVSVTLGTTWHEIQRVRIWRAVKNPSWQQRKEDVLQAREPFKPVPHNVQASTED